MNYEAHAYDLKTHLDGARLLNTVVTSNRPVADYVAPFDTVMLCLSKGSDSSIGALPAGSVGDIARARTLKQQSGLRTCGPLRV
jgi:threonine aldolase